VKLAFRTSKTFRFLDLQRACVVTVFKDDQIRGAVVQASRSEHEQVRVAAVDGQRDLHVVRARGATFVFAGSRTVRVEPPPVAAAFGDNETGNGPAFVASGSVVSAVRPPLPSRAVRRICSDSGDAFTPAKPT
jgi:hypothetical protein